ncbi:type IX secretion system membrane protein PorP/SprF [Oceanihabitans sp. 2_MG-2023]|uniref:PorP/SprF family type IX secretion system membrane protein n=1 Tax=Oceanihabitans sp. 2_MG-2023 TaxID=3062661 RepID=UPI0026E2ECFF|nr:type IX secretion system membrane protein PorP/SprF [Oceanihabitans sp. 2_MG-2023]MDO6596585.1 type IX secretion system membrane protein PorP/SprF [Oceanihabitans sp. 2_MG-2023]
MKNYCIVIFTLIVFGVGFNKTYAQQDAQYTQYMYNTLSINPAYAGSRDVLSFVGLYRTQWVGLDGAPESFTGSVHSPIGKKMGLGVNITNDQIFITNETYIDIDFSYTLDFSNNSKLALGLKAGGHFLTIDTNRLNTGAFNTGDSEAEINIDNKFSPQFGIGAYYYTDKFYLGLSVPNMLETKHFDENSANTNSFSTAKERVNFYLMTGYVFDINEDLKFKPSGLVKLVDGAPLQVDLSANFLIMDKFTVGAAYRWSAALSAMVGFQISDRLMLGFAYDRETTEIQQYNDGSYEVFLRYELFKRKDSMVSPRFF